MIPTCPMCGIRLPSRLNDSREDNVFCEPCRELYARAESESCAVCNKPLADCLCSSDYMKKNGLANLVKVFHYRPGDPTAAQNYLIYTLKRTRNRRAVEFCASHLAASIRKLVPDHASWTVTYAPRSAKTKRVYGHDQSALIGKELARLLGIPFLDVLKRDRHAAVQKKLNRNERLANMRGRYQVDPNIDLSGKRLLLVDDVVTSGATMLSAAKALRQRGAKRVIGVTVGIAYKEVTAVQINRLQRKYALKEVQKLRRRRRHGTLPPMAARMPESE